MEFTIILSFIRSTAASIENGGTISFSRHACFAEAINEIQIEERFDRLQSRLSVALVAKGASPQKRSPENLGFADH